MSTENFSTEERIETMKAYKSQSDEVCYAARRLKNIGAVPFTGSYEGENKDILAEAIIQAKNDNQMVAVCLPKGEGNGMFLISPGYVDARFIDSYWPVFVENAAKDRWDKPLEEQKKAEKFDRFENYTYTCKLYDKWNTLSKEGLYAAERMEKRGIEPYEKRLSGAPDTFESFKDAMLQAKEKNKRVGIYLSGDINGCFVIAPEKKANDDSFVKDSYAFYKKNQNNLRWDKPLEQQEIAEKTVSKPRINE